ncbi:MAG: glycyl-radical enzyme activating protein [Desulfovibrio sp.]|jgi:pyruvate formate lyase activating enzyme|nr:glycyl-radical enzyme activating protein [Desulfovibrio sp.]
MNTTADKLTTPDTPGGANIPSTTGTTNAPSSTGLADSAEEQTTGIVFNIQRFSVHDGPGIRTTVFLKGCPLRCAWCSNPEGLTGAPQLMYMRGNCAGCLKCIEACPNHAASLTENGRAVDPSLCESCGMCAKECYFDALKMEGAIMTVPELMKELRKDANHYRRSDGGITLSGGEALTQLSFCAELFKACHAEGWHTAVETTAYIDRDSLDKVLPHLDLVLMDIKHADSAKHKEYTGVPNKRILQNARYIAEYGGPKLVIRTPVIPGFNDTAEEILAICAVAQSLPGVDTIHLLPFHRMGRNKYEHMQYDYRMEGVGPLTQEKASELHAVVRDNTQLVCKIGG